MRVAGLTRLGLELLDLQLIDRDGVLCGRVDDLRFEIEGEDAVLDAIVSGPGTWADRLPSPLQRIARAILASSSVVVPIAEVESVHAAVHLKRRAAELGLGLGDEHAGRWVARLPWSQVGENR